MMMQIMAFFFYDDSCVKSRRNPSVSPYIASQGKFRLSMTCSKGKASSWREDVLWLANRVSNLKDRLQRKQDLDNWCKKKFTRRCTKNRRRVFSGVEWKTRCLLVQRKWWRLRNSLPIKREEKMMKEMARKERNITIGWQPESG